MNAENEWSDSVDATKVERAVRRIEVEEVWYAMNRMKIEKVSGPSGLLVGQVFEIFDKLLEEWMLSSLVPIFKGKGDPLNPNSYMGIKLLEHAF